MLKIGHPVNDFETDVFQNEEIRKAKLSGFREKQVVLLFYPADCTFVCPTELKETALPYELVQAADAEIISTDTAFAHKALLDESEAIKQGNLPMGADPTGKVSREFGTYIEKKGLALREIFIINPDGALKTMEMHDRGSAAARQRP